MSTTERRAATVFGECRDQLDRGESVDLEDLCRAHPDLAPTLRRKFAVLRLLERAYAVDVAPAHEPAACLLDRLLGPYRLGPLLGSGGMGTVHLATVEGRAPGLAPGDRVAVKVVHPHLLSRPGFFQRFLREAEIGRAVRHPNVVRTIDADQVVDGGTHVHYFVMEYVEGRTLRSLLEELGRVPEELCRHVGREVAKALAAIHAAGAVHRDVKPENILITKDHVVKVMDLGVARLQDEVLRLSQTGVFVGSVRYAAPEQFRSGGIAADGRADLYALGLTLYELATGRHPFADDDFHVVLAKQMTEVPRPAGEVNPQLSAFLEDLLRRLLEKDRERRWPTATALADTLEQGERSPWWRDRANELRATTKRPLRRIRIPRETALYGRDAELTKLRALYDAAKSGEGQVVLVEGEAGIGKTRLLDEFVSLLQREGEDLNFLFGGNAPGGAATAAGAFTTAYREQFGDEELDATLVAYLTPTPILVPAFAALLCGEGTPEGKEPLTKDSLQTVFVHATRALAAERPTIVLIDDLHFAPEEGRALFAALAMAVPGHRVLLVGTTRPGLDEKWIASLDRLDQTSRVALARLGAKDLARLLVDAFHSARLAQELSFKIAAKSDGNPYFVFEILRGLRDGQFIKRQPDGTWVTTRIIADIELPSTVKDLIFARIGNLPTEERNLLDVAACAGFEFDPVLVGEVVGLAPIPALQRLAGIEKSHRLVRAAARQFVFDHHQVAEVLYAAIPEVLREHYHASIAFALESLHGAAGKEPKEIDGALCVDLAEHLLKGAQGLHALRYLDAALAHLEMGYLNDGAIRLADLALAAPHLVAGQVRCEVLLRKATRLELLGKLESQRKTLDEALALTNVDTDPVRYARARVMFGLHLHYVAPNGNAFAVLSEAAIVANSCGDRLTEAAALRASGVILQYGGRLSEARILYERCLQLARAIADRPGEALALGHLSSVLSHSGRYADGLSAGEGHLVLARAMGDRRSEAVAAAAVAGAYWHLGRLSEARAFTVRCLELACSVGDRRLEANTTGNLGSDCALRGDFAGAEAHQMHYLSLSREIADRGGEALATSRLGSIRHSLGRLEEAWSDLRGALAIAQEVGAARVQCVTLCHLGHLLDDLGDVEGARASLRRCLYACRDAGLRTFEGLALLRLAKVAMRGSEHGEARVLVEEALSLYLEIGERVGVGESLSFRGQLRATAGEFDVAAADLEQAGRIGRQLDCRGLEVVAGIRLGTLPGRGLAEAVLLHAECAERLTIEQRIEALSMLWQATHARANLTEAKRLLDHLVAHAPLECRESMLTNVRLHREIAAAAREHGL